MTWTHHGRLVMSEPGLKADTVITHWNGGSQNTGLFEANKQRQIQMKNSRFPTGNS